MRISTSQKRKYKYMKRYSASLTNGIQFLPSIMAKTKRLKKLSNVEHGKNHFQLLELAESRVILGRAIPDIDEHCIC